MVERRDANNSSSLSQISKVKVIIENNIDHYCEYSPQSDWDTYLNWTPKEMTEEAAKDLEFIQNVISFYGLEKGEGLDNSFPKLAMALKK